MAHSAVASGHEGTKQVPGKSFDLQINTTQNKIILSHSNLLEFANIIYHKIATAWLELSQVKQSVQDISFYQLLN